MNRSKPLNYLIYSLSFRTSILLLLLSTAASAILSLGSPINLDLQVCETLNPWLYICTIVFVDSAFSYFCLLMDIDYFLDFPQMSNGILVVVGSLCSFWLCNYSSFSTLIFCCPSHHEILYTFENMNCTIVLLVSTYLSTITKMNHL